MFGLIRTEQDQPKHSGISYLPIGMHQPGIEARPLKQVKGNLGFNVVLLTHARTPKDWIIGKRGEEWLLDGRT